MLKRLLIAIIAVSSAWLGVTGCKEDKPPEKKTIEKLKSDDPTEQKEGLDEANRKYGSGR